MTLRTLKSKMKEFQSGTLRGFALDADKAYSPQDYIDLAATGANVVRVPIRLHLAPGGDTYLPPDLTLTWQALTLCAPLGVRVILVLVPLPDAHDIQWWDNPAQQQQLADWWVTIAKAVKQAPALQAYDIINEPVGAGDGRVGKTRWMAVAQVIATALRAADARTPIMVEPHAWGLANELWQTLPIKVRGLVYSIHWYEPHAYTMQQDGKTKLPAADFGEVLAEARKFSATHGIPIFVGEFGAMRWAPDRPEWMRRAVALFNAESWGWACHVWRPAWEGFDPERDGSIASLWPTNAD